MSIYVLNFSLLISVFFSSLFLFGEEKNNSQTQSEVEKLGEKGVSDFNLIAYKLTNIKDPSNTIFIVGTIHVYFSDLPKKLSDLISKSDVVYVEAIERTVEQIKTERQNKSLSEFLTDQEIESLHYRLPLGLVKESFEPIFGVPFCHMHPQFLQTLVTERMVSQLSLEMGLTNEESYFTGKSKKMDFLVAEIARESNKELLELDSNKHLEQIKFYESLQKQAIDTDYSSLKKIVNNYNEAKPEMEQLIRATLDGDVPRLLEIFEGNDEEMNDELTIKRNLEWVEKVKKVCVQKQNKACLITAGAAHVLEGEKESFLNLFLNIKDQSGDPVYKLERI